jgi:hypothetical protein
LKIVQTTTTSLRLVGFLKALVKLTILLLLGAAIAGVVVMMKRPQLSGPTSFDEWPDVPTNPGY